MVTYSMELVEETFQLHVFDNFKCHWNWFVGGGGNNARERVFQILDFQRLASLRWPHMN